jgi:hypothetical protein
MQPNQLELRVHCFTCGIYEITKFLYHPGTRIGRIRVIFTLPRELDGFPVPKTWPTQPLAYIEWYLPLKPTAHSSTGMYHIKKFKPETSGLSRCSIISLAAIRQSCMLSPSFGEEVDEFWTSTNVLDVSHSF